MFINTGFRIDVAYNEAADVLTFSPNGTMCVRTTGQMRKEQAYECRYCGKKPV